MKLEKKEIWSIIASVLLMALIIGFVQDELNIPVFVSSILISAIIIGVSVFSKKFTAYALDIELKQKIWEFRRYWISTKGYFRTPIPIGLILPVLLAFLSAGMIKFFAFIQFEARALPAKAVKKYGLSRYQNYMEWDDALIVFYSTLPILLISIIASFSSVAFLGSLSKYSLYYAISNLIPLGKLDGTKLFFGSRPLFVFTWILAIITALTIAL